MTTITPHSDSSRNPEQVAPSEDLVLIGRLSRPHALTGEIRIYPFCEGDDTWEAAFENDLFVRRSDGSYMTVKLGSTRPHGLFVLARFVGFDDRTAIEKLEKCDLFMRRSALPILEEDAFYECDLEGMDVVDGQTGESLGSIKSIRDSAAQSLLVVARPQGGEAFIPFHSTFIKDVDMAARRLTVELPPGLLEVNESEQPLPS